MQPGDRKQGINKCWPNGNLEGDCEVCDSLP